MSRVPVERPPLAEDPHDVAERVEAARHLLRHPLVPADERHARILRLVRRHQGELTRMFADGAGYRLHVDPSGARLFKTGLGRDATRPLLRRSGTPFTPRAYALFSLVLAALTRSRTQLLVDELVAQVRSAAVDAGVDVDLDGIVDRRALHAALLALVDLGVLRERDGDLEHWVDKRTQSLLDVRRDLLAILVATPLSSARSPDELLDRASLPSAVGGARVSVRRRLLESPVLTVTDLPDEHAEWWRRNRNRESEWFRDRFGLVLELRAEGAIAVDPADALTDEEFPGRGGTRHLALLCLEALADDARDGSAHGQAWRGIPLDRAEERCRAVLEKWRDVLRRDQRESPAQAVDEAIAVLESMGVARRERGAGGGRDQHGPDQQAGVGILWVHAASSRYAPAPAIAERADSGELSLFATGGEDD
ncbi:hypothetical protein GCM10023168_21960 [Fodinibacter luteus]|uniref:TIGR02678 family protein n=1 Tax=Fodinibacter luteus TaxID=552064 RepID=A0ABP8KGN5_9MICO